MCWEKQEGECICDIFERRICAIQDFNVQCHINGLKTFSINAVSHGIMHLFHEKLFEKRNSFGTTSELGFLTTSASLQSAFSIFGDGVVILDT